MIAVSVSYRLSGSSSWRTVDVPHSDYFDLSCLDELESLEVDSVPLHDDVLDYVAEIDEEAVTRVEAARITIQAIDTGVVLKFSTTFWNGQRNRITERVHSQQVDDYELVIVTTVSETPPTTEILRIIRRNGILVPVLHSHIIDNPDGSETEQMVDVGWCPSSDGAS